MDAPEAVHDPWATSLEIANSTAPEHDHEPQDFPPEIGTAQGLEAMNHVSSFDTANQSGMAKEIQKKSGGNGSQLWRLW